MIVCFGSINLDLIFALDRLPGPGETLLGPHTRIEPGGKGANQAVAAARDGARVLMAGAVGRDAFADGALALLREAGADVSRVARVEAATGCAAICTDPQGRNQIAVGAGANLLARADQVEDAALGPGTTLLLQMETEPAEVAALIRRARALGTRVVLNLAPARPLDADALRGLDLLVMNEPEAAWLAGQLGADCTASGLHAALGIGVIRTLSAAGAEYAAAGEAGTTPARAVRVVDSTAAGDCFTGVLAAALDRGAALRESVARANAAAGLCCTRAGSQGSLPLAAETDAAISIYLGFATELG